MKRRLDRRGVIAAIGYSYFFAISIGKYWTLIPPPPVPILDLYITPALIFSDFFVIAVLLTNLRRIAVGFQPARFGIFTIPLIGLGFIAGFTLAWAILPPLAAYTTIRWWLAILVYLWLSKSELSTERAIKVFLIGLGINVAIGFGQIVVQGPLGIPGELALDAGTTGAAILEVGDARWLRPYGLTFHPNVLAGFLTSGLLLGLPLVYQRRFQALWVILLVGLLASFSRSAWLAHLFNIANGNLVAGPIPARAAPPLISNAGLRRSFLPRRRGTAFRPTGHQAERRGRLEKSVRSLNGRHRSA